MKLILLIFSLSTFLACHNKKVIIEPIFRGSELLSLANGSKKDFIDLIDKAGFHVTDTSWRKTDGIKSTGYNAENSRMPPDILRVQLNKDSSVIFLSFETKSKNDFLQIREDFIGAGFKVLKKAYAIEQLGKENNPMEILMQNSEKNSKTFYIFMEHDY